MAIVRTYTVGNNNRVYRLDNHTGPWIDISPSLTTTVWNIMDVKTCPNDPDRVIIVGGVSGPNTAVLVSNDAGVTWNYPSITTSTKLYTRAWWVDTNTIWVVGQQGDVIKSTDGGLTFTSHTIPYTVLGGLNETFAIHAISDQVAIVTANDIYSITPGSVKLFKTIDGGVTWFQVGPDLTTLNSNIGYAHSVYLSSDQTTIIVATANYQLVSNDAGSTFSIVGTDDMIINNGRHMMWFPTHQLPTDIRHVGGIDKIVNYSQYTPLNFNIIRSNNGGPPFRIDYIHFYEQNSAYYVSGRNVYYSTNGAISETLSMSEPHWDLNAVWTGIPIPTIYKLISCDGTINTQYSDSNILSGYVGGVIEVTSGSVPAGCYTVEIHQGNNQVRKDTVDSLISYANCEACLGRYCGCPEGFTYNKSTNLCESIESVPAITSNTIYDICKAGNGNGAYGDFGVRFYENVDNFIFPLLQTDSPNIPSLTDNNGTGTALQFDVFNPANNTDPKYFWKQRLTSVGIWTCNANGTPYNEWIGFSVCIQIPESKIYTIGIAGDNQVRIKLDGTLIASFEGNLTNNFKYWNVIEISIPAGTHFVELEGLNNGSFASFGAEIYNADRITLEQATLSDLDNLLIFSTKDLIGQQFQTGENSGTSCPQGYILDTCNGNCSKIITKDYKQCNCYLLTDCSNNTNTILVQYKNGVTLDTNQIYTFEEYPGVCWSVSVSDLCTLDTPELTITDSFYSCEACLPKHELGIACDIKLRLGEPGFSVKYCNEQEYLQIKCKYADEVYRQMVKLRYGVEICCEEEFDKWDIKHQLLELGEQYDPDLCKPVTTPVTTCCLQPCDIIADIQVPILLTCPAPTQAETIIQIN